MKRIGIFSGTFDPVHKGHIALALNAVKSANLDTVYFAPEIKPRRRSHGSVTHFGHRVSMLELAARSQPNLGVLQLHDANFTAKRTLPRLQHMFDGSQLVLILGSDLFKILPHWPHVEYLLERMEIVVGIRSGQEINELKEIADSLPVKTQISYVTSENSELTASMIREKLANGNSSDATLKSIIEYARKNWLYHDLSKAESN